MHCSFCDHPLTPETSWKGTADRLYCSEFCADLKRLFLPACTRRRKRLTNNIWHGWNGYYPCGVRSTGNPFHTVSDSTLSIGIGSSSGAGEKFDPL